MTSSQLLTQNETADYIGVKSATLEKWRFQKKHLPFVRVGGKILYRKTELDAFLASRTVQPVDGRQRRARLRR